MQHRSSSPDQVDVFLKKRRHDLIRFVHSRFNFDTFQVEDIVQVSLFKFYQWASEFDRADGPITDLDAHVGLLMRIARNESISVLRKERRRVEQALGSRRHTRYTDQDPFDSVACDSKLDDRILGHECEQLLPEFFLRLKGKCRRDLLTTLRSLAQQYGSDSSGEEYLFIKQYLEHGRRDPGDGRRKDLTFALRERLSITQRALYVALLRMRKAWNQLECELYGVLPRT